MNPLTNVKNINKLNEIELAKGTVDKKSWHDMYKDSAWVFIGGLAYGLTEGDILTVFSQCGEIVNINLVRDKKTGKTKGFCFLCFANQKSTVLAVDNLNGIKLCSRTIRVDHVANYKPPKEDERDDEVTKLLKTEGCAPKAIKVEQSGNPFEGSKMKKKKKLKKEKKKHKKRKHGGIDSDGEAKLYKKIKIKKEKFDAAYDKHEIIERQSETSVVGGSVGSKRMESSDSESSSDSDSNDISKRLTDNVNHKVFHEKDKKNEKYKRNRQDKNYNVQVQHKSDSKSKHKDKGFDSVQHNNEYSFPKEDTNGELVSSPSRNKYLKPNTNSHRDHFKKNLDERIASDLSSGEYSERQNNFHVKNKNRSKDEIISGGKSKSPSIYSNLKSKHLAEAKRQSSKYHKNNSTQSDDSNSLYKQQSKVDWKHQEHFEYVNHDRNLKEKEKLSFKGYADDKNSTKYGNYDRTSPSKEYKLKNKQQSDSADKHKHSHSRTEKYEKHSRSVTVKDDLSDSASEPEQKEVSSPELSGRSRFKRDKVVKEGERHNRDLSEKHDSDHKRRDKHYHRSDKYSYR